MALTLETGSCAVAFIFLCSLFGLAFYGLCFVDFFMIYNVVEGP